MGNSLGFIEIVGMLGAIEACDAAVKSANVELVGCELTKGGGWVTITLKGDVAAVKAGVDAAVASAERIAKVVSYTVIARPSEELGKITPDKLGQPKEKKDEESENKNEKDEEKVIVEKPVAEVKKEEEKIAQEKISPEKIAVEEKVAVEEKNAVAEKKMEEKHEIKTAAAAQKSTGTTRRRRTTTTTKK
ncbi:BMC domain-containing protein [uncultured Ilyobacter sp.]|uniref:BMC domain-containing protein n=1 Tax=uncultured Ilyobacter sp. TaxID=544433 RepID=UPI002AA83C0D|nr:BMC domain-containing protein [uncultured Ilyobacter sp.]